MTEKVLIRSLLTGVPGLDQLLGGGIPEFSLNILAGSPGSGKTTLAHQIMFGMATPEKKALYISVLGEPPVKMLRYQQQFTFFDPSKINESIHYLNMSDLILNSDFDDALSRITNEVNRISPTLVLVDSIRALLSLAEQAHHDETNTVQFIQRLGLLLSSSQTTTLLIGEYRSPDNDSTSIFTVADGVIHLTQSLHRNSVVRKIQVVKMRGHAQVPGLHTFRIQKSGLEIFPRAIVLGNIWPGHPTEAGEIPSRLSLGKSGIDAMLSGGLPSGYSLLVVGPSGSGKTILATEFLAEGVRSGENGVVAIFEKSPYQSRGNQILSPLIESGHIGTIESRVLDLSLDEVLHDLTTTIKRLNAKRVVIDSLSGFELSLAPEFSEDFRSSLYRMVAQLTAMGVTILMTSELEDRYTDLRFSPFGSAFMADAIIVQRYVEISSEFKRVMSVIKVRGSPHEKSIRLYDIDHTGVHLGQLLTDYQGIMGGRPEWQPPSRTPSS
ncbi:MAG: protein kinase [Betaproteobacteria bacterium]|nr:protein kinase [Betaproteobacteria bacterium]